MKIIKNKVTRKGHSDLKLNQIQEIFRLRSCGYSFQEIGKYVKCSKSRANEIYNHQSLSTTEKKLPWYEKGKIVYQAIKKNRGRPKIRTHKLQRDLVLLEYVVSELKDKKSPKSIAFGVKQLFSDKTLCSESIYHYVYHYDKSLIKFLVRYGRTKRNNRASGQKSRILEIQKRNIEQRPKEAKLRLVAGHREGDCMVSARGGKSCLVISVDRYNRQISLKKVPNREAETLRQAYFEMLRDNPEIKTLTLDNDPGHNNIPLLEKVFNGLEIFFCNPYSPWERGTVEAIIGILRRWFPNGTNFDDVSDEIVEYVEHWFNNRHSEVLNGLTPNQMAAA